jgi:putative YhdH/YhfP family quinone oxidoreductase
MTKFKAFRIFNEEGKVVSRLVEMALDELDPGEVTIKTAFSSINFKDALAATGAGKIIRRFPCVGGIDGCGVVVSSSDPRFKEGDQVIATSYDIGVAHDGGYAQYMRLPAGWVVPLPRGMSLFDSMALGTAGFTAGLAVVRMEHEGLKPANGPVIVTGATGGVGSIAIDILAGAGYHVVALTGKEAQSDYLKGLGAKEVMLRSSLDLARIKPLDKATWAGAVDNLGGEVLAWLASTMNIGGTLASIGLAASHTFNTTVMPFILRGVSVLGVDSVNAAMPVRQEVWQRLASDLKPRHLQSMVTSVELDSMAPVFDQILKAQFRGRAVVNVSGSV